MRMLSAASVDPPAILAVGGLNAQRQVAVQLAVQALADVARGDVLAVLAEEWRVVDGERHRHGWLVDGDARQRFGTGGGAKRVANLEAFEADDGADIAARHRMNLLATHALESVQFLDFLLLGLPVLGAEQQLGTFGNGAAVDAADGDAAHVGAEVETGDEHLRLALVGGGRRDALYDGVEHRGDVAARLAPVAAHPALLGGAVDGGEVELVLGGVEVEHQVKDHLVDLVGTAVRLVDLVDDHDGL